MKGFISGAITQPVVVLLISVLISIAMIYGAKNWAAEIGIWSDIATAVSVAVLTSGTFGLFFNFIEKNRLISATVHATVGQTRALDLGVTNFLEHVNDADSKEDILTSTSLIIGVRYSSSFLDSNKYPIIRRMRSGKRISVIRMSDETQVPKQTGYNSTVEDFFRRICQIETGCADSYSIFETSQYLCYNFVKCDRGIWVKMYFNSPQGDMPPAFFVATDSRLFENFSRDIDLLFSHSKQVLP